MCRISVPNLKEIHPGKGCFFWLEVVVLSWCEEEEKYEKNWAIFRNAYFKNFLTNVLQIWYAKSCIWRAYNT